MTQKNYFNGAYLGCDTETGLGMPEWDLIAQAYGLEFTRIDGSSSLDSVLDAVLNNSKPQLIEVAIDPEQTYWPKISSRILENGAMASNPLHLMTPDLSSDQIREFLPFLADRILR
jgi:acetolactate synthase-1/2/3 large subunit